jgi:DNA-directed RNA polymerase subunit E'/Rpb7
MVLLKRKVIISPEYLDDKLMTNIVKILKDNVSNECSEKDGYIISIGKIKKVMDACITSANSDIVLNVIFDAQNLKPKVGDIFEGNVNMIFDKGIFVFVKSKLKILISFSSLEGYSYDSSKNVFFNDSGVINIGDMIKVKISGVRYDKKNFNCFGTLQI